MIIPRRNTLALRTAILAALAASGLSTQAAFAADGFAIEDNELTITGGGASAGFSQTATLNANGEVEHINNVPSTDGVGVPSFSFDLITSGLSDGNYDFRVAVVFDKQGSQSRIEAKIESLILTVAGGNVTGTIPGGTNALRLLGRNGNGALEVQMNVTNLSTNGPVSISGNNISFNGANLIQRIRNSNPSFDTIILEEFDETAAYDYRIIVQQKAGAPETVTFSTESSNVLTALPKVQTAACATPCATAASALLLNGGELAAGFTDAYSVTGSFNVVPAPGASPSASPSPVIPDDGGPGPFPTPTGTPPEEFDLEDLLGDLDDILEELEIDPETGPTEEQLDLIDEAFGNLEDQLSQAQEQLENGTLTVAQGFELLTTGGETFIKGGEAADLGGPIDVAAAAGTLGGFADVIAGMVAQANGSGTTPGSGLTEAQIDQIATFTEDKLESAANMITQTTSVADVEKMVESTADLINKTLEAGAELSPELVTAAVQIALKAVNNIAGDVAGKLGVAVDITDPDAVRDLLSEPSFMTEVLDNTPSIASRVQVDSANAKLALSEDGIDAETANTIVAALGNIVNPSGVALPGGQTAAGKLLDALSRAFGGGGVNAVLGGGLNLQAATSFAVDVDAITGALRVRADAESYAATSTAVRLVPSTIPEGVSYLADGRAVAVADGVAIELAPAAVDVLGFAAAVQKAGFPATFRTDGSLALALANNQRFSGTFAYDNLGSITSTCGAISFSDPQGAVNAASYAFTMRCANGITQRILPFVDNSAFFSVVTNSGLTVRTDRNTGAITIGTVGRFKPSFFVNPLTTADQTYLTQVGTNGFAFRSRDVNGDGRADYEVISSTGVQILYAMP